MKNKITLVTPPDFFENSNISLALIDINEKDQETITNWFANSENEQDLTLYFYASDGDPQWLLNSVSKCDLAFVDVDNLSPESTLLLGYMLSKRHVYFQTRQEQSGKTLRLINANQVPDMDYFLNEVLNLKLGDK